MVSACPILYRTCFFKEKFGMPYARTILIVVGRQFMKSHVIANADANLDIT